MLPLKQNARKRWFFLVWDPRQKREVWRYARTCNREQAEAFIRRRNLEQIDQAARADAIYLPYIQRLLHGSRGITLLKLAEQWHEWRASGRTGIAAANQFGAVKRWLRYAYLLDRPPQEITVAAINNFLNRAKPVKYSTRGADLAAIQAFCCWLHYKQHISQDASKEAKIDVARLSHEQKEPRTKDVFTAEEVALLCTVAGNGFWKPAILLGWETGWRFGDVCTCEWANVQPDQKVVRHTNKTNQRVELLPLSDRLSKLLQALPRTDRRWVFPWPAAQYLSGARVSLCMQFRRLCQRAGVPAKGFHALRRAYAQRRAAELAASHPASPPSQPVIELVARELGHSSASTTLVYL